jgi:hypothetical protein
MDVSFQPRAYWKSTALYRIPPSDRTGETASGQLLDRDISETVRDGGSVSTEVEQETRVGLSTLARGRQACFLLVAPQLLPVYSLLSPLAPLCLNGYLWSTVAVSSPLRLHCVAYYPLLLRLSLFFLPAY